MSGRPNRSSRRRARRGSLLRKWTEYSGLVAQWQGVAFRFDNEFSKDCGFDSRLDRFVAVIEPASPMVLRSGRSGGYWCRLLDNDYGESSFSPWAQGRSDMRGIATEEAPRSHFGCSNTSHYQPLVGIYIITPVSSHPSHPKTPTMAFPSLHILSSTSHSHRFRPRDADHNSVSYSYPIEQFRNS